MFRRKLSLLGLSIGAALLSATGASAQTSPIKTTRVMSGLSAPIFVTHAPGDASRLFVLEQGSGGTANIKIFDVGSGTILGTPFLTITGISTGGERGLLGLAFPPDYSTSGFFYVYVSSTSAENAVWRYTVSGNPNVATAASKFVILAMADPFSNHNGGWIDFGADGYLYVNTGDGGSANDPNMNGQNLNSYLGKQLRIDPAGPDAYPADATKNYAIPSSNPFFGVTAGLDEIWHYGLRNPWRASFDSSTGDTWIGDVGQGAIEEVDFVPAGVGGLNFGWRCMEGNSCTGLSGCTCGSASLTGPKQTYAHSGGACSITGGYRYRGTALCGWQGTYFYADYCSSQISSFGFNGSTITNPQNRTTQLAPGGGLSITTIVSFGEDASNELYIVDQNGGEVFKIVPGTLVDCNNNGIHDGCDIENATSFDLNLDGIPDECQAIITAYCFGDGSGTACPCGNAGIFGAGCANSVNGLGADLSYTGSASLSSDSLNLLGGGMPDSSALYFQGTAQAGGGAGTVFGDGLRCATTAVLRLGTKINVGGASTYPEILDQPISVRGAIVGPAPVTRTYQVWYRNAATYCTISTFNLTNGLNVVWSN